MKRLIPLVVILAVMSVAYFALVRSGNEDVTDVKFTIPASPNPSRIIVDRPVPLAEEGREKLILERSGERWRIVEPIESDVPGHFEKKLSSMFSEKITMDDLDLPAENLAQYGLDPSNRVSLKIENANGPTVEIEMGLGIVVPETGVKRTYVESPAGKVYRARTDVGIVFQQPLSLMRDKNIFNLEADELNLIVLESEDMTYRFVRRASGGWEVAKPEPGFDLEQPLFATLERQLTNFRVRNFIAKGRKELGLDNPDVTLILGTIRGDRRLEVKAVKEPDRVVYYAVLDRSDDVVELLPSLGAVLVGDRNLFRNRLTRDIGRDNLRRVELGGAAGVVIERRGPEDWEQVEPVKGKVSPKELGKFLGNLEMLSVIRYSDASPADAGLSPESNPSEVVAVAEDGTRHVLLLGAKVDEITDERFAKWQDGDDVFVLPQYLYDRLHPGAETILLEE